MREAVKIIISRMQAHPEEFESGGRFDWFDRWISTCKAQGAFTDEEVAALQAATKDWSYGRFHTKVMRTLLYAEQSESEEAGQAKDATIKSLIDRLQESYLRD